MRKNPSGTSHIVLVGPMGAGKSSVGRVLAEKLKLRFTDLDTMIEAEVGATITSIFANEGEPSFRSRENRAVKSALTNAGASVIATGGGAILDAGNRCAMRAAGTVVYLQIDPAMQLQRMQGDVNCNRPLLATDNPAQRLADLQTIREPLYREVADIAFDTTPHSPEEAADALVTLLTQAMERPA